MKRKSLGYSNSSTGDEDYIETKLSRMSLEFQYFIEVHQYSLLHYAAESLTPKVIRALLNKHEIDINCRDIKGCTPLHHAALEGKFKNVKCLVKNGADVKAVTNEGDSALYLATAVGNWKIVEYLAQNGADVNQMGHAGNSPLHLAAESGDIKAVKCLVKNGADVKAVTNEGDSALYLAALAGSAKAVGLPEHWKIVKYLAQNGADVNQMGHEGNSPLHLAAEVGKLGVVKCLIQKGGLVDALDTDNQDTILHYAFEEGDDNIAVIKYLIELGLDINARNTAGYTALEVGIYMHQWHAVGYITQNNDTYIDFNTFNLLMYCVNESNDDLSDIDLNNAMEAMGVDDSNAPLA
jgi:ankyrin repeat protein